MKYFVFIIMNQVRYCNEYSALLTLSVPTIGLYIFNKRYIHFYVVTEKNTYFEIHAKRIIHW